MTQQQSAAINQKVVLTRKGGPEVLQLVEEPLRPPGDDEVRVRVHATGVGFTDVVMRYGYYPYAPKVPFTPGYEVVGVVDAVGPAVRGVEVGRRVAALTVHRGYARYAYLDPEDLVTVPAGVEDAAVVATVLNYGTAYQMLHRVARVRAGQTVLVTAASGGVGTALLELGARAGLRMYGSTSASKLDVVERYGGIGVDRTRGDVYAQVRRHEPEGVDVVFDALGARHARQAYRLLRRGGLLVSFGFTSTVGGGRVNDLAGLVGFFQTPVMNALPDGRRAVFYGITQRYRKDRLPLKEDLATLFGLLADGAIAPLIDDVLPLTEAAEANRRVEAGRVRGKLVLDCRLPAPGEAAPGPPGHATGPPAA